MLAKKAIFLIICALLFLFAFAYFANRTFIPNILLDKQKANSENFYEVIKKENDVTCIFSGKSKGSDETGPGTLTGSLYVSKDKARLNLTLVPDNGTAPVQSSHLQDGRIGYLWSGTKGMKVNLEESETSLFQSKYFSSEITSVINQATNFSCSKWVSKPEIFAVPTNVNFNFLEGEAKKLIDKMQEKLKENE